jgi:hypothetical protein
MRRLEQDLLTQTDRHIRDVTSFCRTPIEKLRVFKEGVSPPSRLWYLQYKLYTKIVDGIISNETRETS